MIWRKYNGKILKVQGKVAIDNRCCCGAGDCVGCGKWLSDEAGKLVVTLNVQGCGMDVTKTGEPLLGETNCNDVFVKGEIEDFSIFAAEFYLYFTWDGETWNVLIDADLNEAGCTLDGSSLAVLEYECVQCSHFHWKGTLDVLGAECSCGGEVVTFTVDVDLTDGIDCP